MLRISVTLLIAITTFAQSACMLEPEETAGDQLEGTAQVDDPEGLDLDSQHISSRSSATESTLAAGLANYSKVEWCDDPNHQGWGTVCRQLGGTRSAAQSECVTESYNVCGAPVCQWVFIASNGEKFYKGYCLGGPFANKNWVSENDPLF